MVPAPRRNSFTQEDRFDRYDDTHDDHQRGGNFQVVIRVRPALERERSAPGFQDITQVSNDGCQITIQEVVGETVNGSLQQLCTNHVFTFDHVYGPTSSQSEVYVQTAKPAVLSSLEGYNATILAYGQTGTGKTHTMGGCSAHHPLLGHEARGIVPRCMDEIFKCIEECTNPHERFLVRASYLQIYNEQLSDLLKHGGHLTIREDGDRGVYVEGLSEWVVRSPAEVATLMERGGSIRATAATTLNDVSSRSHSVFIIIVERAEANDSGSGQSVRVGKLNLVDLAGSERVRLTGAKGARLEESKKINQSLSALGNVIAALTDNRGRPHIPYRDSRLTRLLEDSLGGNCKTTMMAMVSPALEAFGESLSTLRFAHRAKSIQNNAHVNEDVDASTLLRRYETELRRLRAELRTLKKDVVDKRQLDVVEEKVRRAEEDKAMALTALEEREREFLQEKDTVRVLEGRIRKMSSQLLVGGQKIEDTPQFRQAWADRERRISAEYSSKLADLEKERLAIEEDKQQVDRYKQLMLKQRDIMIALTGRLNERDETIIGLQYEVDTLERKGDDGDVDARAEELQMLQEKVGTLERALAKRGEQADSPNRQYMTEDPNSDEVLTAEEKVEELNRIVDKQRQDLHRMSLEVEDLAADKVSMERLLRQNVSRYVAQEMEEKGSARSVDVRAVTPLLARLLHGVEALPPGPTRSALAQPLAALQRALGQEDGSPTAAPAPRVSSSSGGERDRGAGNPPRPAERGPSRRRRSGELGGFLAERPASMPEEHAEAGELGDRRREDEGRSTERRREEVQRSVEALISRKKEELRRQAAGAAIPP